MSAYLGRVHCIFSGAGKKYTEDSENPREKSSFRGFFSLQWNILFPPDSDAVCFFFSTYLGMATVPGGLFVLMFFVFLAILMVA